MDRSPVHWPGPQLLLSADRADGYRDAVAALSGPPPQTGHYLAADLHE